MDMPVVDRSDKLSIPRKVPSGLGIAKIMDRVEPGVNGTGPCKQCVRCHLRNALYTPTFSAQFHDGCVGN